MSWFQRVKQGLSKTASVITTSISSISKKKIDAAMLQDLEDTLLVADLGVKTTQKIIAEISRQKLDKDASSDEIKALMHSAIMPVFEGKAKSLILTNKPHVILLCGVNGNGKTTTAGKLADQFVKQNKKVMLVACDTFRAAASDQLKVWAERAGAAFAEGANQADPASVAFKALEQAVAEEFDVVIIDTAGRLHNKQNLMDELGKISRVLAKLDATAPHETILVIDATTGQNALSQVEVFAQSANLTGLIITKLDGTAKGGILVNITQQFGLGIYAIGVGEAIADLDKFDAKQYVDALIAD